MYLTVMLVDYIFQKYFLNFVLFVTILNIEIGIYLYLYRNSLRIVLSRHFKSCFKTQYFIIPMLQLLYIIIIQYH